MDLKHIFTCIAISIFILFNVAMIATTLHYIKQLEADEYDKGEDKSSICQLLKAPARLFFSFCLILLIIIHYFFQTLSLYNMLGIIVLALGVTLLSSTNLNKINKGVVASFDQLKTFFFVQFMYSVTLASYLLISASLQLN